MEAVLSSLQENFNSFNFLYALGIATAYFIADSFYAYYTLFVVQYRAVMAATTGALIHFLLAFGVLSYTQNYLYVIPIVIGSWIGTYVVVKSSKTSNFNLTRQAES